MNLHIHAKRIFDEPLSQNQLQLPSDDIGSDTNSQKHRNSKIMMFNQQLDISQITEYLYISAWPKGDHATDIIKLGVRLVLSMHWVKPSKTLGNPPVELIWLPTIDFPLTPIPISKLWRGVEAALPIIKEKGAVLVHCRAGVHRSVAMACCILIGMGYTAEGAMQLVTEKREAADPYAWHIQTRIYKFENIWHTSQNAKS